MLSWIISLNIYPVVYSEIYFSYNHLKCYQNMSLETTFSELAFTYRDQVSPHIFLGLPLGLFVR